MCPHTPPPRPRCLALLPLYSAQSDSDELGHKTVTLEQCLAQFTAPEVLSRDNKWYCSKCKDHVQATKSLQVWRLPEVLVLHLKRFEYRCVVPVRYGLMSGRVAGVSCAVGVSACADSRSSLATCRRTATSCTPSS